MRTFELTPGYYEWHLNDKATGETLHNVDSEDVDFLCYDPAGLPLMFFEVVGLCHEELQAANEQYKQGEDYNGIKPSHTLTAEEMKVAAQVMAETLYNYYIAA